MLRLVHPLDTDTFPHQIVCLQLVLFDPPNPRFLSVSVDPVPSGTIHEAAAGSWWCDDVREEDKCVSWPVRDDGTIRCFVKLYPGQNEITFRCRGVLLLSQSLWFIPGTCCSTTPGVQFVYVRCSDGEGRYQYYHPGSPPQPLSGEDQVPCRGDQMGLAAPDRSGEEAVPCREDHGSQETGLQKVKLHAMLAQCFYAEELVSRGYTRKTFNLTEPEVCSPHFDFLQFHYCFVCFVHFYFTSSPPPFFAGIHSNTNRG